MYRRGARPCSPRQRPFSAPPLQPSPSTWLLSRLYAPPNAIDTSQALVATAHYTFPIAEIGRGLGTLPISLQRTSAAFRLQAAAIDSLRPERLPLSAGVELHQDLMMGDLFGLSAQLGVYQGGPALGGGLQFLFTLTSNEGGAESAAGRGVRP